MRDLIHRVGFLMITKLKHPVEEINSKNTLKPVGFLNSSFCKAGVDSVFTVIMGVETHLIYSGKTGCLEIGGY